MSNIITLQSATNADGRAAVVKGNLSKTDGKIPTSFVGTDQPLGEGLLSASAIKGAILQDFKATVRSADSLRTGSQDRRSIDFNLVNIARDRYGFAGVDDFFHALGVDPSRDTLHSLASMPEFEEGFKWLVPEIVREAIRLGVRRNPIYANLIAAEESVTQNKVTMPSINMSDATPEIVNEAETIPVGSTSFNQKDVKLHKVGTGLKISDEVQKYVSLNILNIYLQDVGVKLSSGLDALAIDTLINGDSKDGAYSAPTIGVSDTAKGIQYEDMLFAWLRMGRLGRLPSGMLSNELAAMKILQFPEFKGANYANKVVDINIKTPIPQTQDFYVHGAMPNKEILGLIDRTAALIKLNSEGLKVESERIAERQITGTYVTTTTGFAKMFRDAFLLIDASLNRSTNGFPAWMNMDAESIIIK